MNRSDFNYSESFQLPDMPTPDVSEDPYADIYANIARDVVANDQAPMTPEAEEVLMSDTVGYRTHIYDLEVEKFFTEKAYRELARQAFELGSDQSEMQQIVDPASLKMGRRYVSNLIRTLELHERQMGIKTETDTYHDLIEFAEKQGFSQGLATKAYRGMYSALYKWPELQDETFVIRNVEGSVVNFQFTEKLIRHAEMTRGFGESARQLVVGYIAERDSQETFSE